MVAPRSGRRLEVNRQRHLTRGRQGQRQEKFHLYRGHQITGLVEPLHRSVVVAPWRHGTIDLLAPVLDRKCDRGWVVFQVQNRMGDPGDGSVWQDHNISILHYAGDGRWRYEEDVYNPTRMGAMVMGYLEHKKSLDPSDETGAGRS